MYHERVHVITGPLEGGRYLLLPSGKGGEDGLAVQGGDHGQLQHGGAAGGGGGGAASGGTSSACEGEGR